MRITSFAFLLVWFLGCFSFAAGVSFEASSEYSGEYAAANAFDGNPKTRWASRNHGGEEFLQIDLGQTVPLGDIEIVWENAFAVKYDIFVSDDKEDWKVAATVVDGKGGKTELTGIDSSGRYVRIRCNEYGPHPLYSIFEVRFGSEAAKERLREHRRQIEQEKQEAARKSRALLSEVYGFEEIVFAQRKLGVDTHWYANFGHYADSTARKPHRPGGQLCKLDVATGKVTVLLNDENGSVRDPVVHYEARKILFSYRKGNEEHFHLWEINVDGSGLKQLTYGSHDDIEPIYMPNGEIMFVSSRAKRWVNCWLTPVAILYRCDGDGGKIRQMSANIEHDNTPWMLPDGRVLYTRWEYIDRSQVHYHHLWTANPDGTNHMTYFGNMHPGGVFIDAKPIPGSDDILMIDSPGHGLKEHVGWVARLSPKYGPDELAAKKHINSSPVYRDPYPLSTDHFIVASGRTIQLMDSSGQTFVLYELDGELAKAGYECHEPRPVVKRRREPVIPGRTNMQQGTGRLLLTNVYEGRSMSEVQQGSVKKLLVMESLPKPINYTGGMDPLSYGGTFTLERVVGTVPVERDGSAFMELPANRSFFFIALDKNDNAVKRMQSFTSVAPGELSSCVGCHENRSKTPDRVSPIAPMAAMKRARRPEPIQGIPEVFDFPRDIQPILDKHCVKCHSPDNRKGKILLTGDRGPMFSHSYVTLTVHKQFVDGRNDPKSNYPPYALGAFPSPLMKKVLNGHQEVELSERELKKIRYWIESGAPYPGTYAALGTGMIGGYQENRQVINSDHTWPESIKAAGVIKRKCGECHTDNMRLPKKLSDESGLSFWRPNWNDKALLLSRHSVFNLSRPQKSLMLMAPLAKEAGGLAVNGDGEDKCHPVIFENKKDDDYKSILAMIQAGKKRLDQVKRFDMPGFKPREEYIREMKKYGIVADNFDPTVDEVDVYRLDELYWQSLWYDPKDETHRKNTSLE
ncbi:translocation protein TolB [Anaerohalosphaera lusitana]|uniref:Translocation protein TolB n=1 Tax=Anaerohalosphaera lusitana TaxID=1936003 RepID=A0A1U9NN55_9BACT|nr:discoidin domain-containing protein [Anaerohalosphaera lusitana]AQT69174.1 translocation protein TolB [Anaerohalosphaera lusitana]